VEWAGGAVVVILIVLFATGALDIGGGDSGSSAGTTTSASFESGGAVAKSSKLTQAILEPVDGGDAKGLALFGRIGKNVVLQVQAQGLDPSPQGQSYSVWLYRSSKLVLRVGAAKVGEDGQLAAQLPIPTELLAYVAGGAFNQIAISLLSDAEYEAALAAAKKRKQLPGYLGTDVLRGPITGPAVKQQ
jgi:hypothetical protein